MQYTPPRRRVMIGGAQPPKEREWQTGKTAASIDFANEATQYLEEYKKELHPHQGSRMKNAHVAVLQRGRLRSFVRYVILNQYLNLWRQNKRPASEPFEVHASLTGAIRLAGRNGSSWR